MPNCKTIAICNQKGGTGKWGFADQAFFIHNFLRTIPTFLFDKLELFKLFKAVHGISMVVQ